MAKAMTTEDIKALPEWPDIRECIFKAMAQFKQVYPNSRVELVDKVTCFHIEVDGEPVTEIDAESFKSNPPK